MSLAAAADDDDDDPQRDMRGGRLLLLLPAQSTRSLARVGTYCPPGGSFVAASLSSP